MYMYANIGRYILPVIFLDLTDLRVHIHLDDFLCLPGPGFRCRYLIGYLAFNLTGCLPEDICLFLLLSQHQLLDISEIT